MNSKLFLTVGLLAVVGVVVWATMFREAGDAPAVPQDPTPVAVATPDKIEPKASSTPFVLSPPDVPEDERLLLPDGTWVRALNGVKHPANLNWPSDRPFAAITGTEFDKFGQEWYKFDDGSRLTMKMIWRKDLGRYDAINHLANPATPAERRDDEMGERPGPVLPTSGSPAKN